MVGRFSGGKFDRFTALHVPNFMKTRQRRTGTPAEESKPLPLVEQYDGNLHDFIANLRRVNGNLAPHEKYGPPVNIFAPGRKFWIKASTSAFKIDL